MADQASSIDWAQQRGYVNLDREMARTTLTAKRDELRARLADREVIEVTREADAVDDGLQYSTRDVATILLNEDRRMLKRVEAAIRRLDTPAWGICAECGEAIAPKRLAAVPWAECCIDCQSAEEAERRVA
jgi:DnaK suppressor protein